jgi:membrane-bound lytic murein transglycosylase D
MTASTHLRSPGLRFAALVGLALALAGCSAVPRAGPEPAAATAVATAAATAGASPAIAAVAEPAPQAPTLPDAAPPAPAGPAAADEPPAAPPAVLDPLNPDVPLNLADSRAQADLWERVRRGFAMPDLDSDRVRNREQWYATRPDYVQRMTARGSLYLFHIVEELEKRGMPTELALLPFIESAFNPQALSTAKASGMWQFIPSTGKHFDLKQNLFRDDRRDVLASTRAALDYLGKLYGMFGDWHLALAAYNWGEGSVGRAIARNRKAGLPTDYESLRMPAETALYVPKLQAVKNIIARPYAFGLVLPSLANHPYFVAVPIERDIDVDLAARLAGLTHDEFLALNPQMNKPVILAAGTPQVLLPYDSAAGFVNALGTHHGPMATWTAWVAPKTLAPAEAARLVGMDEARLREVNRIPPRMLVKAGSTLLVPRGAHRQADVPVQVADTATIMLAAEARATRRVALKAGPHDTVASVARRYRVSVAQVAQWNGMGPTTAFKPGQTIVVHLAERAPKAAAPAATRTAAARSKPKLQPAAAVRKPAPRPARVAAASTPTTRR